MKTIYCLYCPYCGKKIKIKFSKGTENMYYCHKCESLIKVIVAEGWPNQVAVESAFHVVTDKNHFINKKWYQFWK